MSSSVEIGAPQQEGCYLAPTGSNRSPAVGSDTSTAEIILLLFARHGIAQRYCRDARRLPARRVDLSEWW